LNSYDAKKEYRTDAFQADPTANNKEAFSKSVRQFNTESLFDVPPTEIYPQKNGDYLFLANGFNKHKEAQLIFYYDKVFKLKGVYRLRLPLKMELID